MRLTDKGWNDNQEPSFSLPCLTLSAVFQLFLWCVAEHPWLRRAWEYTGGATLMTAWMTVSVCTWNVVITRLPEHVLDFIYNGRFFTQKDFEHFFTFSKSTF